MAMAWKFALEVIERIVNFYTFSLVKQYVLVMQKKMTRKKVAIKRQR